MKKHERINLMMTITRRDYRDAIIGGLRGVGVTYNMTTVGETLGGHSARDYLGLEDDEVDVILSVVSDSKADRALAFIEYCGYIGVKGEGRAIALLMPIKGVSGPLALEYAAGPDADG